jgi:hypothetical protein
MNYHTLTALYLVFSVILFAWLGTMWSKKTAIDSFFKLFWYALVFIGVIILYKFK